MGAQDRTLKVQKKRRKGINGEERVVVAEWVDNEVRSYLNKRKIKNKTWREARRNNQPKEILKRLEEEYKRQQKETSKIIGMKKGAREKKKIIQAKTESKIIWNTIEEILGRPRRKMNRFIYLGKIIQSTEQGKFEDILWRNK